MTSRLQIVQTGGCIIFITGFIELILGSLAYGIVEAAYGAWYAGLVCMVAGVLGMTAKTPNMRNSAYCFSIIAVIVALIGLIIDLVGFNIVRVLDTCVSSNGDITGNEEYSSLIVFYCGATGSSGYDCTCLNSNNVDSCWLFNMVSDPDNCLPLTGVFPKRMRSDVSCMWSLFWFTSIYSVYLCTVNMCYGGYGGNSTESVIATYSTSAAPQQQQVVYVDAQGNPVAAPQQQQVVYVDAQGNPVAAPQQLQQPIANVQTNPMFVTAEQLAQMQANGQNVVVSNSDSIAK